MLGIFLVILTIIYLCSVQKKKIIISYNGYIFYCNDLKEEQNNVHKLDKSI